MGIRDNFELAWQVLVTEVCMDTVRLKVRF